MKKLNIIYYRIINNIILKIQHQLSMLGQPFYIVDKEKLVRDCLSSNPSILALSFLERYPEHINKKRLFTNKNNKYLKHIVNEFDIDTDLDDGFIKSDEFGDFMLSENILNFDESFLKKIKNPYIWSLITYNEHALHIIRDNLDKIDIEDLLINKNPDMISIVEEIFTDKFDLENLLRNNYSLKLFNKIVDTIDVSKLVCYVSEISRCHDDIDLIEKVLLKCQDYNVDEIIMLEGLSENINGISLIEKVLNKEFGNKYEISWRLLSGNKNAIHLLEQEIENRGISDDDSIEDNIDYHEEEGEDDDGYYMHLEYNFLEIDHSNIDWYKISANENAINIMMKYKKFINMDCLCRNPNIDKIIDMIFPEFKEWYNSKIDYPFNNCVDYLLENPNGLSIFEKLMSDSNDLGSYAWFKFSESKNDEYLDILKRNPTKIRWSCFATNTSPKAIQIIRNNVEKLFETYDNEYWHEDAWYSLAENPNGVDIIEENIHNLDIDNFKYLLCMNPNATHLFVKFDYEKMTQNNKDFKDELNAFICNPEWLSKLSKTLGLTQKELINLYQE